MPRLARKRAANVVVMNIDTKEYQTEWVDAERQSKFVQRLDESGARWETADPWRAKASHAGWDVDSDFDASNKQSSKQNAFFEPLGAFTQLSPKQFQQFVKRTRELRPAFHEYLEQDRVKTNEEKERLRVEEEIRAEANYQKHYGMSLPRSTLTRSKQFRIETEPVDLYAAAQSQQLESEDDTKAQRGRSRALTMPQRFISDRSEARHVNPASFNAVAPYPHKYAGLSYHHPSRLQNVLTAPPLPGWVLPTANFRAGFMAPPPAEIAQGASSKHSIPRTEQNYVVHVGGSYAARLHASDVFDEPTGQMASEKRVVPFSFFSNPSTPSSSNTGSTGRSTFRPSISKIMTPPTVVHDVLNNSTSSERGMARFLNPDRSVDLFVKPWATVENYQTNPHAPGTPASVAHRDTNPSKGWKKRVDPGVVYAEPRPVPAHDGKEPNRRLLKTLDNMLWVGTSNPRRG